MKMRDDDQGLADGDATSGVTRLLLMERHHTLRMDQTCETAIQGTTKSLRNGLDVCDVEVLNCCLDLQLLVNGMLRCVETATAPFLEPPCTTVEFWVEATTERWEEPLRHEATMVLEPLREEALTTGESHVRANVERLETPLRHEATMVLEPLREEALTAMTERQVSELKDELELLWERQRSPPQRMQRDARASSRAVCSAVSSENGTDCFAFMWRITLPVL